MGILDIFRRKEEPKNEANTLFGQTALGNNIVYQGKNKELVANTQILYVTTSAVNNAGRVIDVSVLSRNSTVMACVGMKARALAQLPIRIMCELEDGTKIDLGPGSIDLAEDLTGKGHITRVIGNEDRVTLAIPVADK